MFSDEVEIQMDVRFRSVEFSDDETMVAAVFSSASSTESLPSFHQAAHAIASCHC